MLAQPGSHRWLVGSGPCKASGVAVGEKRAAEEGGPLFERLAYVSASQGPFSIYVMGGDGSTSRLLENPHWIVEGPAWSPDGSRIAFGRFNSDILVVRSDGEEDSVVKVVERSADPSMPTATSPSWSPDGRHLTFGGWRESDAMPQQVYVVGVDGTDLRPLPAGPGEWRYPAWSPSDEVIAMVGSSGRDRHAYLHWIRPDGSGLTRLAGVPADGRPAWSPDGARIAFATDDGEIWIVNADGSELRQVGNKPLGYRPAWSPGGTHIAYDFAMGTSMWIYVTDVEGTHQRPLVDGGKEPAFAPVAAGSPLGSSFSPVAAGSRHLAAREARAAAPPGGRGHVTVPSDLAARIGENPAWVGFQLQAAVAIEAAAAAFEAAAEDIHLLGTGEDEEYRPMTTSVLPLADGPVLSVYAGWGDEERRQVIVDILSRRPAAEGVFGTLAVLDPAASFNEFPPTLGPGATLRLHPAPSADNRARGRRWNVPMPESWLDEVAAFVTADLGGDSAVAVGVTSMNVLLPAHTVTEVARHCRSLGPEALDQASFAFLAGDPGGSFRAAYASFIGSHSLVLASGGTSDDERLASFAELVKVAERLSADIAYASASFENPVRLGPLRSTDPNTAPPELIEPVCDEVVIDAYPFQVLGPGHLARLGLRGQVLRRRGRTLNAGAVGVPLGPPGQWLNHPAHAQALARKLLAPCIQTGAEVRKLLQSRLSG